MAVVLGQALDMVVEGMEAGGGQDPRLAQGAAPAIDSGGLWVRKKQGEEWLVGRAERGTVREIGESSQTPTRLQPTDRAIAIMRRGLRHCERSDRP